MPADRGDGIEAGPAVLDITMVSNRSLSRRGVRAVILLLSMASLMIGTLFWWLGAWPVPGFCGLEVLAASLLLRRGWRLARASEQILLRPGLLLLRRTDTRGNHSVRRLQPYWLRVELLDRPGAVVRVRLRDHSVCEEVGSLLGEAARRGLAARLEDGLLRCKKPGFDNPRLSSH